jgi:hypothetical protein
LARFGAAHDEARNKKFNAIVSGTRADAADDGEARRMRGAWAISVTSAEGREQQAKMRGGSISLGR